MSMSQESFRLKIASKRQVTLPPKLVSNLHLQEGDEIEIITEGARVVDVRPMKLVPTSLFTEEVLETLGRRERDIELGRGFEVRDTLELRNRLSSGRKVAAQAE